ncbi:hypothetical protein KGQ19_00595 [Catenulispora sp. NL8]|uniref:Type II secretion system protein n=1 Tax=Catenulispora pinistramenti TaxID=2705254 RepID=A0ABS5KGF7_9ACTN|nr:hypothetical protein [Catenulispora pinistramenti]MBS2545357.1 hypothetical protein [Catenulispora pinistramenti]
MVISVGNGTLLLTVGSATFTLLAGLFLFVSAFREPTIRDAGSAWHRRLDLRSVIRQPMRLTVSVGVGLAAGLFTGWPVAALAVTCGVWFAPVLAGEDVAEKSRIANVEGLANWSELLRDTLSSSAGLEQAVLASTSVAPKALAEPMATLGADLRSRQPFSDAMTALGDRLADPIADQVVMALVNAQRNQAKNLADLLGELAAAARAQVTLAVQVDAERAQHRTTQRGVIGIFFVIAFGLELFEPKFLQPYGTFSGQMVMLVIVAGFAASFAWMRVITRPKPLPRLLVGDDWKGR